MENESPKPSKPIKIKHPVFRNVNRTVVSKMPKQESSSDQLGKPNTSARLSSSRPRNPHSIAARTKWMRDYVNQRGPYAPVMRFLGGYGSKPEPLKGGGEVIQTIKIENFSQKVEQLAQDEYSCVQ